MYKIVTTFLNGTTRESTAAMYSIAMMYAENTSHADGVLSVGIFNSAGEECATIRNYPAGGEKR